MIDNQTWQVLLFAAFNLTAILVQIVFDPSLPQQLLLLAPLVAIFGLPHGALDLPIAEIVWPLAGWRGKLRFAAIYLGIAGCVIAIWIVAPSLSLAAFLAFSALHFSGDWERAAWPLKWSGGAATIGAPAIIHPQQVTDLFANLAPLAAAKYCANAAAYLGAFGLYVLIITLTLQPKARSNATLEQIIIWMAAFLLPPLIYFAVYFCGLHSVRHFQISIQAIPNARRALLTATASSLLVALTAVLFGQYQIDKSGIAMPEVIMQVVFIGLAALTVPHMLLVDQFAAHRKLEAGKVGVT